MTKKIKELISITFIALTFIIIIGFCGRLETRYSCVATVLSNENDSVLLVDGAGYIWELVDKSEFKKGDFVKIYFNNNYTDYTREDDIIIKVKSLDN
jgi:secreted trypsin-like serine protease